MIKAVIPLLAASAITASAAANIPQSHAGTYFCKITDIGGVNYIASEKRWRGREITAGDLAFFVKVDDTGEVYEDKYTSFSLYNRVVDIQVKQQGADKFKKCWPSGTTRKDQARKDKVMLSDVGFCHDDEREYHMNFKDNRFQIYSPGGYIFPLDGQENMSTGYIGLGTCDKID